MSRTKNIIIVSIISLIIVISSALYYYQLISTPYFLYQDGKRVKEMCKKINLPYRYYETNNPNYNLSDYGITEEDLQNGYVGEVEKEYCVGEIKRTWYLKEYCVGEVVKPGTYNISCNLQHSDLTSRSYLCYVFADSCTPPKEISEEALNMFCVCQVYCEDDDVSCVVEGLNDSKRCDEWICPDNYEVIRK
jgi:hypothetical protein